MSFAYKAFISYAHRDSAFARRLQRRLEDYRAPGNTEQRYPLRPIFLDRTELPSGPRLSDSIEKALRDSESLIVVCSPAAVASSWVNEEILYFRRLGREAVFPIVTAGEPTADDPGSACFPRALRYEIGSDGELTSQRIEPLAADARKGGDGRDAVLRLISGLLNVSFDTLKLRQQRRKAQQAAAIAGAAVVMVALASYLAVTAVVARQDAERHRHQAEDLISYMLGDLRERLQPVGRLDVLDGVGERALEYFSEMPAAEQTAESMLTRATALRQIGEVRVAQGLIADGLVAFNESLDTLQNMTGGDEALRLFEIGQINYWIADAHFRELELERAQAYIENYLNISRELVGMAPNNADYQLELLYAESNLGTLALRAGETEKAREHFGNALAMARSLVESRPGDASNIELADTISWFGALDSNVGDLLEALQWYKEELALRRGLAQADANPLRRHRVGRTLWLLADVLEQLGRTEEAGQTVAESVRIFRELTSWDPLNFEWQREFAWTLTLQVRVGRSADAIPFDDHLAALALATDVLTRNAEEPSAETDRVAAAIAIERSRIALLQSDPQEAYRQSSIATELLAPLIAGTDRVRVGYLYAEAAYLQTESLRVQEDAAQAVATAAAALAALGQQPDDPLRVKVYGALLAWRAQLPEADDWLSQVAASDYRALAYVPDRVTAAWWHQQVPAP